MFKPLKGHRNVQKNVLAVVVQNQATEKVHVSITKVDVYCTIRTVGSTKTGRNVLSTRPELLPEMFELPATLLILSVTTLLQHLHLNKALDVMSSMNRQLRDFDITINCGRADMVTVVLPCSRTGPEILSYDRP